MYIRYPSFHTLLNKTSSSLFARIELIGSSANQLVTLLCERLQICIQTSNNKLWEKSEMMRSCHLLSSTWCVVVHHSRGNILSFYHENALNSSLTDGNKWHWTQHYISPSICLALTWSMRALKMTGSLHSTMSKNVGWSECGRCIERDSHCLTHSHWWQETLTAFAMLYGWSCRIHQQYMLQSHAHSVMSHK